MLLISGRMLGLQRIIRSGLRAFEIGLQSDMMVSGSSVDSQGGNKLPRFSFQGSVSGTSHFWLGAFYLFQMRIERILHRMSCAAQPCRFFLTHFVDFHRRLILHSV